MSRYVCLADLDGLIRRTAEAIDGSACEPSRFQGLASMLTQVPRSPPIQSLSTRRCIPSATHRSARPDSPSKSCWQLSPGHCLREEVQHNGGLSRAKPERTTPTARLWAFCLTSLTSLVPYPSALTPNSWAIGNSRPFSLSQHQYPSAKRTAGQDP